MGFGSVSNDYRQHIWGAAAYSNQQAATISSPEKSSDFKNALDEAETEEDNLKSFGFGATDSDGGRAAGITAAVGMADNMLSQLQFTLLKNNSAAAGNSVNSRISPISF